MAKHEKEKNLLGELLLETKRRGGGLQLIGWRFCDGPPLFLSLSFLCVLLFLLFFFLSLYHPFWPNLVFFISMFFFFFGWLDQQPAMRESRSSIAGVLKESQKCLWFPPPLSMFFVRHPLYPAVPLGQWPFSGFYRARECPGCSSYLPRIMILGMGISMACSSVFEENKGPTVLPLQDCW